MSTSGVSARASVPARIRVMVADDHTLIRYGLGRLIAAQPDLQLVATAADGASAVEVAARERPDVIVLDLSMPLLDGVSAAEEIARRSPDTRVLVLSSYVQEVVVTSAFNAGVSGYLAKHASSGEVLDGIRQAHAGGTPMSEGICCTDHRGVADRLMDPPRP